jgi:CHAD domain-containing protein
VPRLCELGRNAVVDLLKDRVTALRRQVAPARAQDADGIHDLRVSSRRLRALLATHRPMFRNGALPPFRRRVREVTQLLGIARELDVSMALLESFRSELSGPPRHAVNHAMRRLRALRQHESPHIERAVALVENPAFDAELVSLFEHIVPLRTCYLTDAADMLSKRYRALLRAHSQWRDAPSDGGLHQVRIRFKKLRYTCEVYATLYCPAMDLFIRELKAVQETLGLWNDHRILRDYVAASESGAPARAAEGMPALREALDGKVLTLLQEFAHCRRVISQKKQALDIFATPRQACCRKTTRN